MHFEAYPLAVLKYHWVEKHLNKTKIQIFFPVHLVTHSNRLFKGFTGEQTKSQFFRPRNYKSIHLEAY